MYISVLYCADSQADSVNDSTTESVSSQATPVGSCISSYDVSSNKPDAHWYDVTLNLQSEMTYI